MQANGHINIVEFSVTNGAKVGKEGNLGCVKVLIEKGAEKDKLLFK